MKFHLTILVVFLIIFAKLNSSQAADVDIDDDALDRLINGHSGHDNVISGNNNSDRVQINGHEITGGSQGHDASSSSKGGHGVSEGSKDHQHHHVSSGAKMPKLEHTLNGLLVAYLLYFLMK